MISSVCDQPAGAWRRRQRLSSRWATSVMSSSGTWLEHGRRTSDGCTIRPGVRLAATHGAYPPEMGLDDAPHVLVTSREEWRAWLEANHPTATGVWVVTFRAGAGSPRVPYADLVEEAMPDDLQAALEGRPLARERWDAFSPSTRKGILQWIASAKRPATRGARVEETALLAARGEKANQWPPRH